MKSNSNKRKDDTLGMPHGTAVHRLRKNVLFHILRKHNENICAKCHEEIKTPDEISIEHLLPWEGISAELFWDLNNIAFSHMRCNRPDRPSHGDRTIIVPEGTVWCGACDSTKPKECFTPGAKNQCSECKSRINAARDRTKFL